MNSKKIEMNAVVKLTDFLNSCELLDPDIPTNDKTPSWDGNITVYKSAELPKNSMKGIIRVQVKGKYVTRLSKGHRTYPVEIVDLKNFRKEGGAIFFVVEMLNFDKFKIFYKILLPMDIEKLINLTKKKQKTKSIELLEMPSNDRKYMMEICFNFINDRKKQFSLDVYKGGFANLKDETNIFDNYSFSITSLYGNPFEYIMKNPIYIYGNIRGINVNVPIDKLNVKSIIANNISKHITINGKEFYDKITIIKSKESELILLGKGIKINKSEGKFSYEEIGTLSERIKDIEFMIALGESLKFKIDEEEASINTPIDCLEQIKKQIIYMKKISEVLSILKVKEDLQYKDMTENSFRNINILIKSILEKEQLKADPEINVKRIKIVNIANINVGLGLEKLDNGKYIVHNLFSDDIDNAKAELISDDGCERVQCSVYVILTKSDFLRLSNIDYKCITRSIVSQPFSNMYSFWVNKMLLELVSAYDEERQNLDMLESAMEIGKWLIRNENENDIFLLNYFQIVKRRRNFTDEDRNKLIMLRDKSKENSILLGVSILLENYNDCKIYFTRLTEEEKNNFIKFPIYNLVKDRKLLI